MPVRMDCRAAKAGWALAGKGTVEVAGQAPETETEVVATGAAVWVVAALALVGEGSVVEEGMALATETVAEEKVLARAVARAAAARGAGVEEVWEEAA